MSNSLPSRHAANAAGAVLCGKPSPLLVRPARAGRQTRCYLVPGSTRPGKKVFLCRIRHERDKGDHAVPDILIGCAFFEAAAERGTVAVLAIRDRRAHMRVAHVVVPKTGVAHEYRPQGVLQDSQKLGPHEAGLKCDGEPPIVASTRKSRDAAHAPTILENSGEGGREQLRHGLELRRGLSARCFHPIVSRMVGHIADAISKCEVIRAASRTVYGSMTGAPRSHEVVEFGEQARYTYPKRAGSHGERLERGGGNS